MVGFDVLRQFCLQFATNFASSTSVSYLIRSACLSDYVEIARSVGLEPYRMLNAVGLPRSSLKNPDMKIPAAAFGRLLEASAKASGANDFGLRIAERRQLSHMGLLGLVVREQPSVRKAIEAMITYMRLHNEALSIRMEEIDDLVLIGPVLVSRRIAPARQAVELSVGMIYRILRLFLGSAWKARTVAFTHSAPTDRSAHARVFGGAKVAFGQDYNGILCTTRDLEAPIVGADPGMARYVQQYVDSIAARPNITINDKVRDLVWIMLPSGTCSIDRVAQHLGAEPRTLQRHLGRRDETFSGIVDSVRREMVARYLEDPSRRLTMIADMLGFSALSAFSRWFQTRFGCSASEWRARGQESQGVLPG
jgi:AraC-like DNA-binding protein